MNQKITLFANLLLILLLSVSAAEAQKKKKIISKKSTVKTEVVEQSEASMPEIKDFAFVVNIDKNSFVTMKIQSREETDAVAKASDAQALKNVFAGATGQKNASDPLLIVTADPALNYSDVLTVLDAFRASPKQKAKIEIGKEFYAFVPQKQGKNSQVKPNPLLLVVNLDKNMKLDINGEPMEDAAHLKNLLRQIFKAREENGVFQEGTNIIETTVIIKASPAVKYSEVIKIAEAVREAGSTLIGLATEDFNPIRGVIIENILEL